MKNFKSYRIILLVVLFSGLFLSSCNKDDAPEKIYKNYISDELKTEITSREAIANFTKLTPEAADLGLLIRYDVEVRRVIYQTTFKGKSIQASGLACFPKNQGTYPVLSFQNGTNTLHSDAPSVSTDDELFSIMESIAAMGFIVVIPDYIGFGVSANLPHPYLDAQSSTQSILDMIRAAKELSTEDKIEAKASQNLFIFGYSQGGWATMQLQKSIEKDYSSEFKLLGSSCGAGPYSIEDMNKYIVEKANYPMPYFIAYLLHSYTQIGSVANPLSDFILEPYAAKIPGLFDGKHSGSAINAELNTQMSMLFTPEYKTGYATSAKFAEARKAFQANSIVPWKARTPMKLFHGMADEYIPAEISRKMHDGFIAAGVSESQIELNLIPQADHSTAVFPAGLQTIVWFLTLNK